MCYFIGVSTWKCFYFEIIRIGEDMAEVRKKVVEDVYNTEKIKKSLQKKEEKKNSKVKKAVKKENKTKTNIFTFFRNFFNGVANEFKRVHWTSKENMIKYSIATIFFVFFFGVFFYLIDVLFALVQSLF